ncbi:MAG: hypothetical protein R2883_05580 [Caldisericia bacterium]
MKKITLVLVCLVILSVFAGCQKDDKINSHNSEYEVHEREISTDIRTSQFEKWSIEIDGLRGGRRNGDFACVISVPRGWVFQGEFYSKGVDGLLSVILDPETGEIEQSDNLVLGETKGNLIVGYNQIAGISSLKCVDASTFETKWTSGFAENPTGFSLYRLGNLIIEHHLHSGLMKAFDFETGQVLWEILLDTNTRIFPTEIDDGILIFVMKLGSNSDAMVVDSTNGDVMDKIDIDFEITRIHKTNEGIWVNNVNSNGVYRLNCVGARIIDELKIEDSWIVDSCDDGLLLGRHGLEGRDVEFSFFNSSSQDVLSLDGFVDVDIVNGIIIGSNSDTISGLGTENLNPIWEIECDGNLGENPEVIWQDERGVLVLTEKKLICFDAE